MFHDPAILLKIESNRRLYKHYLTSLRSKFCNQNLINMTQKEFRQILRECIQEYIDNFDRFDSDPQLRINPLSLDVELVNGADMREEIEDSDEAIEDAAAAHGMENQDASYYQAKQNPDFYPVKKLLQASGNTDVPSETAIERIVVNYIK